MTNHETHRAQEAVMTEAQPITEKPARNNRSKKAQDATPAEPVDFKKLAQETREKMAGKKNPPSSEAAAESAQVEQPTTHMPAHARFQLGQVVGVKAYDGTPGYWTGVLVKFEEPETYWVRYRKAGKAWEGDFQRGQLSMMPHPAVGIRLEAGDLVGVRGSTPPQFGVVSFVDEKKDRASVMIAGQQATRGFQVEELDFHGSKVIERSLKFVGLEAFGGPEAEPPTEALPEAEPPVTPPDSLYHWVSGDIIKIQHGQELLLGGVRHVHATTPPSLGVILAESGELRVVPERTCTLWHVHPVALLRPGDLVHLSLRTGVWEVVGQEGDVVEVVNPLDSNEKASSPLSGVLVTRRTNFDDLRADLDYSDQAQQQEDMPFPVTDEPGGQAEVPEILTSTDGATGTELVTPADQPGWIFPRGQHLAHWWNGEKALCGREVADGTNIEANSDPSAYADRTCRKCRAALNKQPLVQAAPEPAGTPAVSDIPAVINDIPEVLTVAAPVQGVAAPIHTIAQPVLEVAQPELSVEQPQDSIQAPIPSELPGTPVLLSPANVKPGTLGVVNAQLSICVKSPCNVRMHYDDTKVQEIAASIKADGQLQECVGRWNSDGMLEIVAGETRRRAQVYRQEQGETGLTLRVHVRDLTDAQALRISAQENMARNDMTPLEECEAMLRMQEAGDTIENIQATFGYKTAQPVADRILVAKNLHEESRSLLDSGELSLAQAMVIARAPGKDLQRELANWARRGHAASKLAEVLTSGQFLVKHALFKVEDAGLSIKRDLFDAYEPYFEDKKAALDLQMRAAQARAEKLRAKGKHTFVEVESGTSAYSTLSSSKKYDYTYDHNERKGLILFVHTDTGEVSDETSYRLKASALEKAKKEGTASKDAVAREMPTTAHEAAHLLKAQALRHSLLGHKHLTLVLTVHALIVAGGAHDGRAAHSKSDGWNIPVTTEAVTAKLQFIQTLIADGTKGNLKPDLASLEGKAIHGRKEFAQLFDFLVTLDEPELLDILNALVAARIYEMGWNAKEAPAPVFTTVAGLTGANDYLSSTFKLTDEWLKRYPRHELVALAEEAGLGRALVEDCGTLKEMRARILEHADTLHKEGFVPKFVRFADASKSAAD